MMNSFSLLALVSTILFSSPTLRANPPVAAVANLDYKKLYKFCEDKSKKLIKPDRRTDKTDEEIIGMCFDKLSDRHYGDSKNKCPDLKEKFHAANKDFTEACKSVNGSGLECRNKYMKCRNVLTQYRTYNSDKTRILNDEYATYDDLDGLDDGIKTALEEGDEIWSSAKLGDKCPEISTANFKESLKEQEEKIKNAKEQIVKVNKEDADSKSAQASFEQKKRATEKARLASLETIIAKLQDRIHSANDRLRRETIRNYKEQILSEKSLDDIVNERATILTKKAMDRLDLASDCRTIYQNNLDKAEDSWNKIGRTSSQFRSSRQGLASTLSVKSSKRDFFRKKVRIPYRRCLKKASLKKKIINNAVELKLKANTNKYNATLKNHKRIAASQSNNLISFDEQIHSLKSQEANSKKEYENLLQTLEEEAMTQRFDAISASQATMSKLNLANQDLNLATNSLAELRMIGTKSRDVASSHTDIPSKRDEVVHRHAALETAACEPAALPGYIGSDSDWGRKKETKAIKEN